jgi:hypothetical protein
MPVSRALLGAAFALLSSLCLADIPGYPSNIEAYDSREVAMLPRYCIYTQLFRERVPAATIRPRSSAGMR